MKKSMSQINDEQFDGYSQNTASEATSRKKSFYRRVSVHHFHVMKDQMSCCCCVPLGMAFHIIACFDIVFMIFLGVEALEYYVDATQDERAQITPAIKQLYWEMFVMFLCQTVVYSFPRAIMYFLTLCRKKSYTRMKYYFRTRIITLLALIVTLVVISVQIFLTRGDLADAYQSTTTFILLCVGAVCITWISIDLYWSIAIRTYKDSKRGKQGQQVAERMQGKIDPNHFLYDNQTQFNPSMQDV